MSFFRRTKAGSATTERRKPTSSFFDKITKGSTSSDLPAAPTERRTEQAPLPVPSYEHADRQKGVVDEEAEARGKSDDEIREAKGKDPKDVEQPTTNFEPGTAKGKGNERSDQNHTVSTLAKSDPFLRYWKLETDHDLEDVIHGQKSFWTPNSLAMFEILESAARYTRDNRIMYKNHPEYLDYGVVCYYSILFYIQILRAKQAANELKGFDRSFFNRFKDRFPLESLPVSSILEPFFYTIVSVLPKDSKYDWIIPTYSNELFSKAATGMMAAERYAPKAGAAFIQPNVPYMLGILKTAISSRRVQDAQAHADRYFNDNDDYVPGPIEGANHVTIYGNAYDRNNDVADDRWTLLYTAGVSHPFHANLDELSKAAPKWRRSKFNDFPFGQDGDHNIKDLEHFLVMEKEGDHEWFSELVNQAALHARFFDGVTNLSKIPVTGGESSLIVNEVRNSDGANHANTQLGLRLAAGNANIEWYPHLFPRPISSAYTSREGVSRQEVLQAMSFAANASFNIQFDVDRPAANTTGIVGGNNPHFRTGPFWTNMEWASSYRERANASEVGTVSNRTTNGKPLFKGWETMLQDDAALTRPSGY